MRATTRIALSALTLLCLQIPAEAKQEQPPKMVRIGDEIVSMDAGNKFIQAQELVKNKQFDQASALLKQFLESYPNSCAGHYKYSFVLLQLGKNSEAQEQAKRCTEIKPDFFEGWAILGDSSANLKQDGQAKAAYQKALAIQATGENADIVKEHLDELNNPKEKEVVTEVDKAAAEQNRTTMKLNNALALCDRANEFGKQKEFEQGILLCRNALKAAPDSAQVKENVVVYINNYAADCVQKDNLKQAEALMKEALTIQSQGGVTAQSQRITLKNYSTLLNFLGRSDEAKQLDDKLKTLN